MWLDYRYFWQICMDIWNIFLHSSIVMSLKLMAARSGNHPGCLNVFFMPPPRSGRRHYVFGLSVRPSVRTSVRPSVRTSVRTSVRPYVRTYVRTYVPFSLSHYLKNRWMDSHQTWFMYVSWGANDLIRFWGHEVKGQRSWGSLYMQNWLVIAISQ